METREEINQRMLSVELAVKEALSARGEPHFTDQEFPPSDQSLFVDPDNPPSKLQVSSLCYFHHYLFIYIILFLKKLILILLLLLCITVLII